MLRRLTLAIACNALLAASGCAQPADAPSVEIKGQRYAVELATSPDARERGLMFRRELPAGNGMLFIHDDEDMLAYWMKNTYIPLDILYFDGNRRLVSAQLDVPPCGEQAQCPIYPSAGPAKYVLELNAGQAQRLGLKPGDTLSLNGLGKDR